MTTAAEVPFNAILVSFLKEAQRRGFNTTVLAADMHQVGQQQGVMVASNQGAAGVAYARQTLLNGANSDETVERVAKALHEFRLIEEGQTAPAPEADMCMFGPCIAAEPAGPNQERPCKLAWNDVPPVVKGAHIFLARLLIAAMVSEPEPAKNARKLVIPGA